MDLLEQGVLSGEALTRGALEGLRRAPGVPWGIDFLLHGLVIAALTVFAFPGYSAVTAPLLAALAGPDALHFPQVARVMPAAIARLDLWIAPLRLPLLVGASAALFADELGRRGGKDLHAARHILRRLPRIVLLGIPLATAYALVVANGAGTLTILHHRPMHAFGAIVLLALAEATVLALAALALPPLVLSDPPLRQLRIEMRTAWRRGGSAYGCMALVLTLLGIVGRDVAGLVGNRITGPRPETGPFIAVIGEAIFVIGAMAFAGGCVVIHALTAEWYE